ERWRRRSSARGAGMATASMLTVGVWPPAWPLNRTAREQCVFCGWHEALGARELARPLQPDDPELVLRGLRGAHGRAGGRVGVDRPRRQHARGGADRVRQDAGGLP